MSESDNDEDLKRAIALSLQSATPKKESKSFIDLISSDEEDDLDAPVSSKPVRSLSKPVAKPSRVKLTPVIDLAEDDENNSWDKRFEEVKDEKSSQPEKPAVINQPLSEASQNVYGILGMSDRKKMEEERLARARKRMDEMERASNLGESRKRKASSPPLEAEVRHGGNVMKSTISLSALASRSQTDFAPIDRKEDKQPLPNCAPPSLTPLNFTSNTLSYRNQPDLPGVQYPRGVVKKTWAYGYPRQADDIKIEEVLMKNELEHAVLSAFQIEPDWIGGKMLEKTKVVWVLQAKGEAEKANIRSQALSSYQFCFPSMEGNINCMHSKLMLLAYKSHLRIVVPSANLVPYDWGESGGVMENIVFLVDLPRHPERKAVKPETFFATELIHFLNSMGLKKSIVDSLNNFDFTNTAALAFVHSIGGPHDTNNIKRTGYCGLGTAVTKLGLQTGHAITVDLVSASIGSLTHNFIKTIYLACQGDDGMTEYNWRLAKPPKSKPQKDFLAESKISEEVKKFFRIYFPTHETVAKSKGGLGAAGTICTQSQWYNGDKFPKELMRDCESRRPGLLMHSKMIFVRPHKTTKSGVKAWAYVGSANLSESAWGHLSKDKMTKQPKLICRNWECGVVFPVRDTHTVEHQGEGVPGIEVFKGSVPVPMAVPGKEYEGRKPWFFKEGR